MEAVVGVVRSYLCCFCFPPPPPPAVSLARLVRFSSELCGPRVRVANFSVGGTGVAFANTSIDQTRAYWEFRVVELGDFYVGVARRGKDGLDGTLGERKHSWGLDSGAGGGDFKAGDVIGVTYDVSQGKPVVQFFRNGERLRKRDLRKVRGDVCPAVSVSGGCLLEANFGQSPFEHGPPAKFDPLMFSQSLI